ncbi:MAG: hypothetical protein ACOVLE_15135 [Pirellula staleyi]
MSKRNEVQSLTVEAAVSFSLIQCVRKIRNGIQVLGTGKIHRTVIGIEEYTTFIALKWWDSLKLMDFAGRTEGFDKVFAFSK